MAKHVIYGAFGLAAAIVIAVAIYVDKPVPPALDVELSGPPSIEPESQEASVAGAAAEEVFDVIKVIDGDTVTVQIAGETETVRIIGIDAPETGTQGECFAAEATNALKTLVGTQVRLEKDLTQGERDKYDRVLAYVFSKNGVNVAEELIRDGFAKEYTYSKAYTYQKEFRAAQKSAQEAKRGMWAADACVKPAPAVQKIPESEARAAQADESDPEPKKKEESKTKEEGRKPEGGSVDVSGYTCSTNTYNCSDFSTHAEAQAVYEQCGGAANDVHKLDSNKDGEACESLP